MRFARSFVASLALFALMGIAGLAASPGLATSIVGQPSKGHQYDASAALSPATAVRSIADTTPTATLSLATAARENGPAGLPGLPVVSISSLVATEDGLAPIAGGAPKYPFTMSDSQFGAKLAQHAGDFGLDPSNPADRAAFEQIVRGIGGDAEQEVPGTFRGEGPGGARGPVLFPMTGSDVVVTTPKGEFVTVLQGGINNPSVQVALEAAGQ